MSVRRVCFVTDECNGLSNAGGIGACVRGLAQWLTANGAEVDILIAKLDQHAAGLTGDFASFASKVYFLADVAQRDATIFAPVDEPSKSYHVYRFLRQRGYDEVHFNDWLGTGFYTAMARRQGLFDAAVVSHLHGGRRWVRTHNLQPPELHDFEIEAMEQSQIENSDLAVSPSHYLLDWCRAQGMKLPETAQRNWILPQWAEPDFAPADDVLRTRAIAPGAIDEIVFFGRHERRKGFRRFVDAIARLPASLCPDITFVGRFDRVAHEHTGSLALHKLRNYAGRLRFLHDLNQAEALDLLRRSRRALAVMPSVIENSPCTIGECFTLGVPFLASDVGGTAELVGVDSRQHCLTRPDAADLAHAIERVMTEGMPELVSTLNPLRARENWLAPCVARPVAIPAARPLVSVCVTHYERPHLLRRAYQALLAQTYDNIEIVIVDDGSRSPGAHAYLDEIEATPARFPVKIIRGPNRYLGAARNIAAKASRGEYLLFHDDDNFAEPRAVETFVSAALAYGADVLTAQCYVFHDGEEDENGPLRRIEYYPLGVGGVFSFFHNRFGDANALVRRATFDEIGGFTEDYGVGFEDWEFFLKAFMAGKRMGLAPEPLFNYRASATGMLSSGNPLMNFERIYRAVDNAMPRLGADMLRFASRAHLSRVVLDNTWHQMGRERGADLLRELMDVDPNGARAFELLSELALNLGRTSDAIEIGAKSMRSREKVALLLSDPAVARRMRRAFDITVLEPTKAEDAVFLEGWAIDGAGEPLNIPAVWAGGRWLNVAGVMRRPRPDVRETLKLASERDIGFQLYAFAATAAASPTGDSARGLFGRPLGARGDGGLKAMHRAGFSVDGFDCNLPAGPGWRGHVDRGGWQRAAKIALKAGYEDAASIEIETSVDADPVILWEDGALDWGKRLSGNRTRFTRKGHDNMRAFTVVAPSTVRTHVVVS